MMGDLSNEGGAIAVDLAEAGGNPSPRGSCRASQEDAPSLGTHTEVRPR